MNVLQIQRSAVVLVKGRCAAARDQFSPTTTSTSNVAGPLPQPVNSHPCRANHASKKARLSTTVATPQYPPIIQLTVEPLSLCLRLIVIYGSSSCSSSSTSYRPCICHHERGHQLERYVRGEIRVSDRHLHNPCPKKMSPDANCTVCTQLARPAVKLPIHAGSCTAWNMASR
jgi:hypothetical protein